jgi:cell division protein FtsN
MTKETGSSRTDTIVKVMLVFFISLLSFSVGTFVGKQVSDSDHRRMALESEFQGREVASSEGTEDGATAKEGGKVTDKEVENLAEEFVNKEKGEGGDAAPAGQAAKGTEGETEEGMKVADTTKEGADGYKTYSHGKEQKKDDKTEMSEKTDKVPSKKVSKTEATDEVSDKVANDKAASDGEVEQRKPSSSALPSVANSAVGKFTVQVGSYATETEAEGQAKNLKGKGWAAFYVPATVSGKTWYRVMVGTFNNHNSAQAFRKDFMKESGMKSALVQKIVQ